MKRTILLYGSLFGLVLLGLNWLQYQYFSSHLSLETYLGLVGLVFLALGWYFGRSHKETVYVMETAPAAISPIEPTVVYEDGLLSSREMEVLHQIAKGHTNQEIAAQLFVSLNTVKTHTSNIYSKLGVSRRTQAVQKAKELNLLQATSL